MKPDLMHDRPAARAGAVSSAARERARCASAGVRTLAAVVRSVVRTVVRTVVVCVGSVLLISGGPAWAGDEPLGGGFGVDDARRVQIASLELDAGVIEVRNFGDVPVDLDGWRFCSHSAEQALRYTNPSGLAGVSLAAGASVRVHLFNDSPGSGPGKDSVLNASDVGTFANRFGQGPYALQLFWPGGDGLSFGDNDDLVDHVQWSVGGVGNGVADARSGQAVAAGLWGSPAEWVSTSGASRRIGLLDADAITNEPGDFEVVEDPRGCSPADVAPSFGLLDLADIGAFVTGFRNNAPVADIAVPFGAWDLEDIRAFIEAYLAGCP